MVYTLAKLNRPFSDLPILLDMETVFGFDMGRVPQSDHSCADIAKHIPESMTMFLFQSITELDLKIGVIIN
jgi:hypothetical protein